SSSEEQTLEDITSGDHTTDDSTFSHRAGNTPSSEDYTTEDLAADPHRSRRPRSLEAGVSMAHIDDDDDAEGDDDEWVNISDDEDNTNSGLEEDGYLSDESLLENEPIVDPSGFKRVSPVEPDLDRRGAHIPICWK
ncbi:unnamed protein product, partial [Meganyctiphanes norvegica]